MTTSLAVKNSSLCAVPVTAPLARATWHAERRHSPGSSAGTSRHSSKSFVAGTGAYHVADVMGLQMRPMSLTLPDDQALRDVAAYIRTLRK